MNARSRRFAACAVTVALLFAQFAVAAFACPADVPRSAPAVAMQPMPGCDEMGSMPTPLCASHCADGAQSFEKPVNLGVAPAALVGTIAMPVLEASFHACHGKAAVARAASPPGPPLSIRNCCLRI